MPHSTRIGAINNGKWRPSLSSSCVERTNSCFYGSLFCTDSLERSLCITRGDCTQSNKSVDDQIFHRPVGSLQKQIRSIIGDVSQSSCSSALSVAVRIVRTPQATPAALQRRCNPNRRLPPSALFERTRTPTARSASPPCLPLGRICLHFLWGVAMGLPLSTRQDLAHIQRPGATRWGAQ